jgi:hypothetical protein
VLIKLDDIHKQIEAIKKIHLGSRKGVLEEIVVQQDHYLSKGIKKALTDKNLEKEHKALVERYTKDLESLRGFFSESPQGIATWKISQFAKVEEAVYDWKKMEASSDMTKNGLTHLTIIGLIGSGNQTTSKPLRALQAADSLFSIPTLLNQSLARFDSGFYQLPIISSNYRQTLFLYPRSLSE